MSELSKNELRYENSVSFPNNNSGEISPADLREFNVSMIDSTVNQTQYTSDSASFDDRLDSVESSITNLNSYTSSTDARLDNIELTTQSLELASSSFQGQLDAIGIQSASWSGYSTASFATTGSNSFFGEQVITSLSSSAVTITSGVGDESPITIEGGLLLPDKFTPSSIRGVQIITGVEELGADALSGSNHYVGLYEDDILIQSNPNGLTPAVYIGTETYPAKATGLVVGESQIFTQTNTVRMAGSGSLGNSNPTSLEIIGDITASNISLSGTIRAYEIVTTIESSSVIFSSGSNILGDDISDTQTIVGQTSISGSLTATGNTTINGDETVNGIERVNGHIYQELGQQQAAQFRQNEQFYSEYYGNNLLWNPNTGGGISALSMYEKTRAVIEMNAWSGAYDEFLSIKLQNGGASFSDWILPSYATSTWLTIPQGQSPVFNRGLDVTGSLNISETFTASLNEGYVWVGDGSNRTSEVLVSTLRTDVTELNQFTQSQELLNQTFATTGSNVFTETQFVSGDVSASGIYSNRLQVDGDTLLNGFTYPTNNIIHNVNGSGFTQYIQNPNYYSSYYGSVLLWTPTELGGGRSHLILAEKVKAFTEINAWSGAYDNKIRINVDANGVQFNDWDLPSYGESTWLSIQQGGTPTFQRGLVVTGSSSGNVNGVSITDNTASLDFGSSNFFTLTLVSGSDTRIEASNVQTGQTVNLKITQPSDGVGTISYPSEFKFPEVAPYSASIVTDSVDIITFVTFDDASTIYSAAVKRLV